MVAAAAVAVVAATVVASPVVTMQCLRCTDAPAGDVAAVPETDQPELPRRPDCQRTKEILA